jgi:hypothetical protein
MPKCQGNPVPNGALLEKYEACPWQTMLAEPADRFRVDGSTLTRMPTIKRWRVQG